LTPELDQHIGRAQAQAPRRRSARGLRQVTGVINRKPENDSPTQSSFGMIGLMQMLAMQALEAGLDEIRRSPTQTGRIEMIVRRPAVDEREVLDEAMLDTAVGLVGDTWPKRPSSSMPDGSPHPEKQITIMNARVAALVA